MSELFRREAMEHHQQRLHGEVILTAPRAAVWLTLLLAVLVALSIAFLLGGSYARKETVPGYLVSSRGIARVLIPEAGTVTEIYVDEGDQVTADEPLLMLRHERPTATGQSGGAEALAAVEGRSTELKRQIGLERKTGAARERAAEDRIDALRQQVEQLQRRHNYQKELVALAKAEVAQLEALKQSGAASQLSLRQKRQALVRSQRDEAELAQDIAALGGAIQEQRQETSLARLDSARRISELEAELHALAEQRVRIEAERTTLVTAPVAGRVAALYASVGRDVRPGTSPLVVLPAGGELEAELYVPTRAVGFVKPGQETRLLYDAFPYQRFGTFEGRVERVTSAIVAPEDAPGPLRLEEPAYRVRVKLARQAVRAADQEIPLQAGMLLRANIILERQRLLTWVTAPLRALFKDGAWRAGSS